MKWCTGEVELQPIHHRVGGRKSVSEHLQDKVRAVAKWVGTVSHHAHHDYPKRAISTNVHALERIGDCTWAPRADRDGSS